jgi:AraC-like DNA-binding protein
MVCPRCKTAVESIFSKLEIPIQSLELGEVVINEPLTTAQIQSLKVALKELGFDLLESEKSAIVSKIKTSVIEQLHPISDNLKVNFSDYLAQKLHHDYSYLSRLFSNEEGITIERFIAKQKIERIKEQLFYGEKTLTEISFEMNYSSVAYLSTQFKKETGMTPTEFKKMHHPKLKSLDNLD